jgi:hypothetical protein
VITHRRLSLSVSTSLLGLALPLSALAQAPGAAAPPESPAPAASAAPATSAAPASGAPAATAAPTASEAPAGEAAPTEAPAATEAAPAEAPPAGEASAEAAPDPDADPPVAPGPRVIVVQSAVRAEPEEEPDYAALPLGYHQKNLFFGLGARLSWVPDGNFDLYSSDDVIPGVALRLGGTVFASGPYSVAVVGEYAFGSASDSARGVETRLAQHLMLLGLEPRWHFLHMLYGYARVSGGIDYVRGELAGGTLGYEGVELALAGKLGAAARIAGSRDGRARSARLHVYAEGGYGFVSEFAQSYEAAEDGPARAQPVDAGTLLLSGPELGLGLMLTY